MPLLLLYRFRCCVLALREKERDYQQRVSSNSNSFQTSAQIAHSGPQGGGSHLLDVDFDGGRLSRSSSVRSNTGNTAG